MTLERGQWSGGRLIGARDLPPKFPEQPVRYGEGLLQFDDVIKNARKPEGMSQGEWEARMGVIWMFKEIGHVLPLNDITDSTAGPHMASQFRITPSVKNGIPFRVDYSPTWNIVIVGSSIGERTMLSTGNILGGKDKDSIALATRELRESIKAVAGYKVTR